MKQYSLIMVIYDSVNNPVFESQVLHYIKTKLSSSSYKKAYIISFEKSMPTNNRQLNGIDIIYAPRSLFMSMFSLNKCTTFLISFLSSLKDYELIARGAYAGYIILNALRKVPKPLCLTVQIRGLLAEEYVYAQQRTLVNQLIVPLRAYSLKRLEKWVYAQRWIKQYGNVVEFEAVSAALCQYLKTNYGISAKLAQYDLIRPIEVHQLSLWRSAIRYQLAISQEAYVYCYNGSVKKWQCAHQTLDYFAQQTIPEAWLLIISSEVSAFKKFIETDYAHLSNVIIKSIYPEHVSRYLAAADEGIIFREPHIINWVSRPTKVLEYQAVGLKITHNNTISMLVDLQQKSSDKC